MKDNTIGFFKNIRAPWVDFEGGDIFCGDTLIHPSGEQGVVMFHPERKPKINQWFVNYDNSESRLCLQIGDKGQAVVLRKNVKLKDNICAVCGLKLFSENKIGRPKRFHKECRELNNAFESLSDCLEKFNNLKPKKEKRKLIRKRLWRSWTDF